jgi:hypothetical protein
MDVVHGVRPGGPGEHQRADAREANRGRMPRVRVKLDVDDQRGFPTTRRFDDGKLVLGDRLDLVGERVAGRVVGLAVGGGMESSGVDRNVEPAEEHAAELEGGMQLADPIEEQPGGVGAGHVKPLGVSGPGPDLGKVACDDLEQTAGGVGHEPFQGRRGCPQAEVGGVSEDFVHRGGLRAGHMSRRGCPLRAGRESYGLESYGLSPARVRHRRPPQAPPRTCYTSPACVFTKHSGTDPCEAHCDSV